MGSQDDLLVNGAAKEELDEVDEVGALPVASIKHPLHHTWTMWYFKQEKGKDWSESQQKIASFSTVEDFWALYNHLQPISHLVPVCDYSLFKEGIRPMWEDEVNKKGGRWLINLHSPRVADSMWLNTLCCLIGEGFEEFSDDVCGAVFNVRNRGNKLGLWTRDCAKTDANKAIGKILKSRLNLGNETVIEYQSHSASASKSSSILRPMFVL